MLLKLMNLAVGQGSAWYRVCSYGIAQADAHFFGGRHIGNAANSISDGVSTMNKNKTRKYYSRPAVLLAIILTAIATVEFLVMSVLGRMPEMPVYGRTLFDVCVLSITIAPFLYLFLFKPLQHQMTSLKRAYRKISRQQAAIEKAQELGHIGTWKFDFATRVVTATHEACRIVGTSNSEACSFETFMDVVHPEDSAKFRQAWAELKKGRHYDIEARLLVDGQLKWIRKKAELELTERGQPLRAIGFIQDITEIKLLQDKAIRTAQLASVGELSTMVAHEVNNPLSGVMGYAQVLINRGSAGDKELLERIIMEGERIAKIVGTLLNFSYDSKGEKTLQDLQPIVVEALSLMAGQLEKQGVRLDVSFAENLPPIVCNPQQIEQVVLNILRNAYQALTDGPTETGSEKIIRVRGGKGARHDRNYVRLELANNGPHIPTGELARIKEPFFTTKPVGRGTGLGLSISGDIMKDHDGTLEIISEPGAFTQMVLSFPVVPGEAVQ